LLTVTADGGEVALLPALSLAVAVMAWLPLPRLAEFHVTCQGAWVADPTELPSTKNWTLLTAPGLEVGAVSATWLPTAMAPGTGRETATVGGVAWLPSAYVTCNVGRSPGTRV